MAESTSIQVHFGRPAPLLPLAHVGLLPQQLAPMTLTSPGERQLIAHVLDGSGQFAVAVLAGSGARPGRNGPPRLRPAVCIGRLVQHERCPDGSYQVLVQGVCRARILRELPADPARLFRSAYLAPVGLGETLLDSPDAGLLENDAEPADDAGDPGSELGEPLGMAEACRQIADFLSTEPLSSHAAASQVLEYVQSREIPHEAILELVSFTIISDDRVRYRLLAEAGAPARAGIILRELRSLCRLIENAREQEPGDPAPPGCSWN